MHPPHCPSWKYEDHTQAGQILPMRCQEIMAALRGGSRDTLSTMVDTRPAHHYTFHELTPPDYDYYAGHYRGEPFECLRFLQVGTQGDSRVGAPPAYVEFHMRELEMAI